jgi:two-component system cell cycle sensor histidine kinase/response regulator CckA
MTEGSTPPLSRRVVLVADDEDAIVRMVTTILSGAGLGAIVVKNGIEGFEKYRQSREQICLVLSDVVMPNGGGLEMAQKILEFDPSARILFMSGYSDELLEVQARNNFPFIRKPFLPADLMRKIHEVAGMPGAS